MAAGLGFKTFNTGDVLSAADVNGYLMQGVLVFADAAARTAAITSPQEGQVSFLKDTNSTEYYSGSAWVAIGGSVPTSLEFTAGKNKIINGDFGVNQRGFTSTTTSYTFGFDRFKLITNDGTGTYSAQTFTLGTAPVTGYEGKNFAQIATTGQSATSAYTFLQQPVESVRTFANQTVVLSFWAKASSGTPKLFAEAGQYFGGSGGSSEVNTAFGTATLSTSWTRYSFSVTIPSISGKTIGTAGDDALLINFWTSAGTNFNARTNSLGIQTTTIQIWGIQLEAGSTATSFQTATGTIQGELAACQRYYVQFGGDAAYQRLANGSWTNTTNLGAMLFLPVTMRIAPSTLTYGTLTTYDGSSFYSISSLTIDAASKNTVQMNAVTASSTQFRFGQLLTNNSTSGYLGLSAEL